MIIVHLTSSTFFGGPERQMLGLAQHLVPAYRSVFLSFSEGGRCRAFLREVRRQAFDGWELSKDTPHFWAGVREIQGWLEESRAGVLCCHGYKADLLGRKAARRLNVPVVAVSRGWTNENLRVRLYEAIDRHFLKCMDRVVCVSEGQAVKVRRAGVPAGKVTVIRNAIDVGRFERPDLVYRSRLASFFSKPPSRIVGAAGRLSPEKGFSVLIDAARIVRMRNAECGMRNEESISGLSTPHSALRIPHLVGFILFGEGPLRPDLEQQIQAAGLQDSFVLAGFRDDLDSFLPFLDLLAVPSFTEGLPNVILEAFAARIPVVATAVGGIPEIVENEANGLLISPGDSRALAGCIADLLNSDVRRHGMGQEGYQRLLRDFTFGAQASAYRRLFAEITEGSLSPAARRQVENHSDAVVQSE